MIWFTQEEAETLEAQLEALRLCDPRTRQVLELIADKELPDEFLESWR